MLFAVPPLDFHSKHDVVSVLVEVDERILLLRRIPSKPQGETWGIPAGKATPGSYLQAEAVRELQEESGIHASAEALTFVQSVCVRYPDFDFVFHLYRLSLSRDACPNIRINPLEHDEFIWRTPQEALSLALIPDMDTCLKMVYAL